MGGVGPQLFLSRMRHVPRNFYSRHKTPDHNQINTFKTELSPVKKKKTKNMSKYLHVTPKPTLVRTTGIWE